MKTKKFIYTLIISLTATSFFTGTTTYASGNPVLSLKINGSSLYEALPGEIVTLTYEIEDCDNWSSSGIHFNYDSRLISPITYYEGFECLEFKRGDASEYLSSVNTLYRSGKDIHSSNDIDAIVNIDEFVTSEQNCVFVFSASEEDSGTNGVILSAEFIVPDNASPGDIYDFEFWKLDSDIFTDTNKDITMQEYAFENWQNCRIIIAGAQPSVTLAGDANCDGKIAVADAVATAAYISNSEKNKLSEQGIINADVHMPGNNINASDALMIQQYATGIINTFSEQE